MQHCHSTYNMPGRQSRSKVTCLVVGSAADLVEVDCRKQQSMVPWCHQALWTHFMQHRHLSYNMPGRQSRS